MNYLANADFYPNGYDDDAAVEPDKFIMSHWLQNQNPNQNPQTYYSNNVTHHHHQQQYVQNMNPRNQHMRAYNPTNPFDQIICVPNNQQSMNQPVSLFQQRGGISSDSEIQSQAISFLVPDMWRDDHRIFIMFMHILFKILKRCNSSNGKELFVTAKRTVIECTNRNRAGDSTYTPLIEALVKKLRSINGIQMHWILAEKMVIKYNFRKANVGRSVLSL